MKLEYIRAIIKQALLPTIIFCHIALLHAADTQKDLLVSLVCKSELIDPGTTHCKKKVTYLYKDTQVGFIYYGTYRKLATCALIDSMLVEAKFRSHGVGGYILKQTIQKLKDDGYNHVRLKVMPLLATNYKSDIERLITFYGKYGFILLKKNDIRAVMLAPL